MSINENAVNAVIKGSENLLQKKFLGGVTTDSASKAIKSAVHSMEELKNKEVAKLRMQLNEQGQLSHKAIADLTSKNDVLELNLKNMSSENAVLNDKLGKLSAKFKQTVKTKTGKDKINANGNIEVSRVNKNGARMTVEYLPNEEKTPIAYAVEDIDGFIRKTTLNPVTGKPIRTYTDTNGGYSYEYLPNGTRVKKVNIKKAKLNQKPTVVNRQTLKDGRDFATIQQNFSDGSYEIINFDKRKNRVASSMTMNSQGNRIAEKQTDFYNGELGYRILEFNPETGKQTKFIREFNTKEGQYYSEKYYAEDGSTPLKIKQKFPNIKRVAKAEMNEYGLYVPNSYNIKYTYPKNSKIATAKLKSNYGEMINGQGVEHIKLKDGRSVELKVDSWYQPRSAIVKDGKNQVEYRADKLSEFLEDIGYRNGLSEEEYAWPTP